MKTSRTTKARAFTPEERQYFPLLNHQYKLLITGKFRFRWPKSASAMSLFLSKNGIEFGAIDEDSFYLDSIGTLSVRNRYTAFWPDSLYGYEFDTWITSNTDNADDILPLDEWDRAKHPRLRYYLLHALRETYEDMYLPELEKWQAMELEAEEEREAQAAEERKQDAEIREWERQYSIQQAAEWEEREAEYRRRDWEGRE